MHVSFPCFQCLQAALVVADQHTSLQITGNGDVLEPHDGVIAIGSGSPYALSAARALIDMPGMDAAAVGACARSHSLLRLCAWGCLTLLGGRVQGAAARRGCAGCCSAAISSVWLAIPVALQTR